MREIEDYFFFKEPLLTFEEEKALGKKIVKGDQKARDELITKNVRLVIKIAKKYSGLWPERDLIQEETIGLIRAADKYDYKKNFRFNTYASWWINQAILVALKNKQRIIRIPRIAEDYLYRINKIIWKSMIEKGYSPSIEEIAEETKLPCSKITRLLKITEAPCSLDCKGSLDIEDTLHDIIKDERINFEEEVINNPLKPCLQKILGILSDRERKVIGLRYGLNGEGPLTLKEVGERYGITGERVGQIEKRVFRKIRDCDESEILRGYLIK